MKKEIQSTTSDRPYSLRDHSSKPKVTIPATNYQLNNYQGIPFPSSNVSNGSPKNNSHLWRKGKWFDEEESYTEKLIEAFIKGYLNIPGGTTLRSFLSEQLCCDPMRITKKFAGSHGIGKHVFAPADMKVVNEEEMMEVLRSLEEAQERFHRKSLQIEPMYHQQFHSSDPYHCTPAMYLQQAQQQDYFMMIPSSAMTYYPAPPAAGSYYYYTPYSEPELEVEAQREDGHGNGNSPKRQKKRAAAFKSKKDEEAALPASTTAAMDQMSYASALLMDFYLSGWRDTTSSSSSSSSLSSSSSSSNGLASSTPSTPAPLAASSTSSRRKRSLEESEQVEVEVH